MFSETPEKDVLNLTLLVPDGLIKICCLTQLILAPRLYQDNRV